MDKVIKEITSKFSEISVLMEQLKAIKTQERRAKRRLKTKIKEFEFLSEIVGLNMKHKKLTEPLFRYFKHLGVNVHRAPNNDKDGVEDLRLFYADKLILIEATSIKNDRADNAKLTQVNNHVPARQQEFSNLKVFGVSIINHQDNKLFNERVLKQNYQDSTVKILKSHNLTSVTTLTLLINFIMIKSGKRTVDELINNLISTGIYEE
jgi:hypothetical protein